MEGNGKIWRWTVIIAILRSVEGFQVKLIAPSGKAVLHLLLEDGSRSNFEVEFRRNGLENLVIYSLPTNRSAGVLVKDGNYVLLDEDGNEWLSSDVEFHCAG